MAIQAENTRKREDYTLQFVVTEQINADTLSSPFLRRKLAAPSLLGFATVALTFASRFESEEAADRHVSEPHFIQFMKSLNEEKVLTKDSAIWRTRTVAGYDIDKKVFRPLYLRE